MTNRNTESYEIEKYWSWRAPGYSVIHRNELEMRRRVLWRTVLTEELQNHFSERAPQDIRILEPGTGPGFFSIILAEAGYDVTAIDFTPEMLSEAKKNAGSSGKRIRFIEMDAESLGFADGSFDAIVSRNLTWNLPHPESAYSEWARVLKPGGLLLNFDANWYRYLIDEDAQAAYTADRIHTREKGFADRNVGKHFDIMKSIAADMPLTRLLRPEWDIQVLSELGFHTYANEKVWERVWCEEEKTSLASTPLFLIRAAMPPDGRI